LRCVPPPPPPPPPSPVSGFGKRKGLTSVRSGSSSPRQWGLLNSHCSEEQDVPFVLSEILESAWGNRGIRENAPTHPISGTLLHERFFAVTPLALETEHVSASILLAHICSEFVLVIKMKFITFSPMLHCRCKQHYSIKPQIRLCTQHWQASTAYSTKKLKVSAARSIYIHISMFYLIDASFLSFLNVILVISFRLQQRTR
jgi:hypothetical protein